MSDIDMEDQPFHGTNSYREDYRPQGGIEEEGDIEGEPNSSQAQEKGYRQPRQNNDEENEAPNEKDEDDDEDNDEEGDEEEEEEEDNEGGRTRKRPKVRSGFQEICLFLLSVVQHRHRRPAAHRFVDIEAEVDTDDEEEEEEEEYGRGWSLSALHSQVVDLPH